VSSDSHPLDSRDAAAILRRKLDRLFRKEAKRREAQATLATYDEPGAVRIHLAVLRLAGSDLAEIRRLLDDARKDFRDVLAWAEYPRQMRQTWSTPDAEAADRRAYEAWLDE